MSTLKPNTNTIGADKVLGVNKVQNTHVSQNPVVSQHGQGRLMTICAGSAGGGASHLCVGNFSFTDWMMSCSTCWSVWVTRSTEELFVITFRSSRRASRTTWSTTLYCLFLCMLSVWITKLFCSEPIRDDNHSWPIAIIQQTYSWQWRYSQSAQMVLWQTTYLKELQLTF